MRLTAKQFVDLLEDKIFIIVKSGPREFGVLVAEYPDDKIYEGPIATVAGLSEFDYFMEVIEIATYGYLDSFEILRPQAYYSSMKGEI